MKEVDAKRDEHFRDFCSKVATEYYDRGGWSTMELETRKILDDLGYRERLDYWHNYKLSNPQQSGYYELDFLFPRERIVIEVDGEVWHNQMGDADMKDKYRDLWLNTLGFKVFRVNGKLFKDRERLENVIREALDGS